MGRSAILNFLIMTSFQTFLNYFSLSCLFYGLYNIPPRRSEYRLLDLIMLREIMCDYGPKQCFHLAI